MIITTNATNEQSFSRACEFSWMEVPRTSLPTRGATTFRTRACSRNVVVTCPPDRIPLVGKEVRGTSIQENSQTLESGRHLERSFPRADVRGVLAVILSAAKDLASLPKRSFAALRMTGLLSKYLALKYDMQGMTTPAKKGKVIKMVSTLAGWASDRWGRKGLCMSQGQ